MYTPSKILAGSTSHSPRATPARNLRTFKCLVLLGLAVSAALSFGCDDNSDRQVRRLMIESRQARIEGDEAARAAGMAKVQEAANITEASAAARAQAKALLAQSEQEEGARLMHEVIANLREIDGLIYEIGALGVQIASSNLRGQAYKQGDPAGAIEEGRKKVAAAQGDAAQPAWFQQENVIIPTLSAVRQDIARLEGEIAERQQKVQTLTQQRDQAQQRANELAEQSRSLKGDEAVDVFTQGAESRKQASDLTTQIEMVEAELLPRQRDLAIAQRNQQAVQQAIDVFQKQMDQLQAGWQNVAQQIERQASLAAGIVGAGGASPSPEGAAPAETISANAALLAQRISENAETFDKAAELLNSSAAHYQEAVSAAEDLSRSVSMKKMQHPGGTPVREAYDQLLETVSPHVYKIGQAGSTQMLGTLHASRAISLADRKQVTTALDQVLKAAALPMPAPLQDANLQQDLDASVQQARESYEAAAQLYLDVAEAPISSESLKNAGRIGRIFAIYGQALLAQALNDEKAATQLIADAKEARNLATENKAMLPALPLDLVDIPAATQPAATAPAAAATPPTTVPAETNVEPVPTPQ